MARGWITNIALRGPWHRIFKYLALRPILSSSCNVRLYVCMYVCILSPVYMLNPKCKKSKQWQVGHLWFCITLHHIGSGSFPNLGLPPSHPFLTFDRDTDVQSIEIIFPKPNQPNEKTSRKQKSLAWYLSMIIIFQNIKIISSSLTKNFNLNTAVNNK